jgi:hypothetical protein
LITGQPPGYHDVSEQSEVTGPVGIAADQFIGPQVLTLAIPLGTLFAVLLWGFFQRRSHR